MKKIEELKWGSTGLIPAVVQDATSGEVLTVAYVSRESLAKTLEIKETVFFSRSRQCLWHKGETSGNTQTVVSITADCDQDALVIRVHPKGPACHTGARSCFFEDSGINLRSAAGSFRFQFLVPRFQSGIVGWEASKRQQAAALRKRPAGALTPDFCLRQITCFCNFLQVSSSYQ